MKIRILNTSLVAFAALTFAACGNQEPQGGDSDQGHSEAHDHDGDHDHGEHGEGHDEHGEHGMEDGEHGMEGGMAFEGPRLSEEAYTHFGQQVAAAEANATASELVADPAAFTGKPVLMTGKVANVCKGAGCWIMLGDGENEVFVDTQHDFAVPTDCDDFEVVVQGVGGTREKASGGVEAMVVASGIALKK
ncbi:MAG: DUF4920 domain-containing protein [Planctomycetota bacterium]